MNLSKMQATFVDVVVYLDRLSLRKWVKRYQKSGLDGLKDQSKRPHSSPNKKINTQIEKWIIEFRSHRNLGARRIQTELLRLHECSLSLAIIYKILTKYQVKPIKRLRRDGELCEKTLLSEEVQALYDSSKEHIQNANYYIEMKLRQLKGSL